MVRDYNSLFYFSLLLLTSFSINLISCGIPKWNYYKHGDDWGNQCKKKQNQAPIDISGPYKFSKPNIKFFYSKMMTESNFLNNGNNLILEGDFGYIIYNNSTYFSSEILFFSPSTHTVITN
jgi:carbonic anhydrase